MPQDPVADMLASTVENGGGTYEVGTYLPFTPADGFAVGIGGIEVAASAVSVETLRKWVKQVAGEWMTSYVGTWLFGDSLHIDGVVYVRDEDIARAIAIKQGQQAIWSFAGRSVVEVA